MRTVNTPIGVATLVGLSPDHKRACCMHTRPKEERAPGQGSTYSRWWKWDAVNEVCVEGDLDEE